MKIAKHHILDFLRSQGRHDHAEQAEVEFPDEIDLDEHGELLDKYRIDVGDMIGHLDAGGGALGGMYGV